MQINELASRLEPAVASVAYIGVIVVAMHWHYRRAQSILAAWAASNGYQILNARWSPFPPLAFWFSSRNQVIYSVTVEDSRGDRHRGWVRCGSFWLGIWENTADVVWAE